MKKILALAALILMVSGEAKAWNDFYKGHQNTEPNVTALPFDCEKVGNYLEAKQSLLELMAKYKMSPNIEEFQKFHNLSFVYEVTCREV